MKRFTKNPQVQEMASINIQCLNIDGINEEKLTLLEDHMLDDGPDIMGIQETKLTKEALYITRRTYQSDHGQDQQGR